MKKVLVTGCSGYIGSHLCKRINSRYKVYGFDLIPPQIEINQFLFRDIRTIFQPFPVKFDAVVHLAALVNVGKSENNPLDYYLTNLVGTSNVLKNVQFNNFIFASTGQASLCINPYSISKRAAEDVVQEYCTKSRIPFTTFRFYNVIGVDGIKPTNPDGLMSSLMDAADKGTFTIFGNDYPTPDGTCLRDYVHVNEICQAIEQAIEEPAGGLENLGHGVGKSVKEMVEIFKQVNNVDFNVVYGERRKGDPPSSVLPAPGKYMKHLYSFEDLVKITKV